MDELNEILLSSIFKNAGFGSFGWFDYRKGEYFKEYSFGSASLKKTHGVDGLYSVFVGYCCGEYNDEIELFTISSISELTAAYKVFTGDDLNVKM